MILHILFLVSLNFVWVTSRNLAGANYQDQFIQEILLRHEEDMRHAPRESLKHDLPVVILDLIISFYNRYISTLLCGQI
jgi:hypothetical protein